MFLQALQEDEDENIEEGARIAIKMLGPEKQHLYPRIFQLVMADTAFTEGIKNNNDNDSDDASSSSLGGCFSSASDLQPGCHNEAHSLLQVVTDSPFLHLSLNALWPDWAAWGVMG